jgi:hypothetical protein
VTPPPPHFGARRFRAQFRQVALAGKCLPILWLILFDLGKSWQILLEPCQFVVDLRKEFGSIGLKKVFQNNNESINKSIQITKNLSHICQKSTKIPIKVKRGRFGKKVGSRTPPK